MYPSVGTIMCVCVSNANHHSSDYLMQFRPVHDFMYFIHFTLTLPLPLRMCSESPFIVCCDVQSFCFLCHLF